VLLGQILAAGFDSGDTIFPTEVSGVMDDIILDRIAFSGVKELQEIYFD
jgi:hypothetical protein